MSRRGSRDIYQAPGANRQKEPVEKPQGQDPWQDVLQRSRRSMLLFRLILIAFLITIGMVLVEQFKASNRRIEQRRPMEMEVNIRSNPVLDLDTDVRMQFVMDELSQMETTAIPAGGDLPLNTHWMKQAAYYLLQAENAYRNEEWERAAEFYEIVKKIFPTTQGVDAQLGLCYMRLRRFEDSGDAFVRANDQSTNSYRVINNLGVAKLAVKDFEEAERLFQQALELNAGYAPSILNLALLYFKTERMEEAAASFRQYFEIAPANIEAVLTYVLTLIALEDWDQAADLLRSTAKARPEAAPIQFRLAQVLGHTGDYEEAIQALRRGINLLDSRKALAIMARYDLSPLRDRDDFKAIISELSFRED